MNFFFFLPTTQKFGDVELFKAASRLIEKYLLPVSVSTQELKRGY